MTKWIPAKFNKGQMKRKKKEGKRNKERKKVYKYLTSYNPLQNMLTLA